MAKDLDDTFIGTMAGVITVIIGVLITIPVFIVFGILAALFNFFVGGCDGVVYMWTKLRKDLVLYMENKIG